VQCDPELSRNFYLLELIDEFRVTGNILLLDKLMCEVSSELTEEDSDNETPDVLMAQNYVIEEEEAESDEA